MESVLVKVVHCPIALRNLPRRRAMRDTLAIVAFTEIPEAHLVEVVEADRTCNRVDENSVRNGGRNDVGQIDGEEVGGAYYSLSKKRVSQRAPHAVDSEDLPCC